MNKSALIYGATFGLLTVLIGAFGSHGLRPLLEANGRLDTFQTAVEYQSLHAIALLIIGILSQKLPHKLWKYASHMMVLGILLFSGSLYFLSLTNIVAMARITPIGGSLFVIGWILILMAIIRGKEPEG